MNYTLVGAFVLGLGALAVAITLWLASGGAWQKRQDRYLALIDESVAGLNVNAPVKYNGVNVGRVHSIRLDPLKPERVQLVFAIDHGTPVRIDTEVVLKTQGLTGIAYAELSGGAAGSALLPATSVAPYPEIRTKPSLSARLENVLSSTLAKLDRVSTAIDQVLNEENRRAFSAILVDASKLSQVLAARSGTIDTGLRDAARTVEHSARAAARFGPVLERIGQGADAVQMAGQDAAKASRDAGLTVNAVGADLRRFGAETLPQVQRLMSELQALSVSLQRLSEQTQDAPNGLLFGRTPAPLGPGETDAGASTR